MSGLLASRSAVPIAPTEDERRKPGFERSIMYQRTGFTRKSVREAWRLDAQGNLRYQSVNTAQILQSSRRRALTIAKAIPTNAPTLLTTGVQSAP